MLLYQSRPVEFVDNLLESSVRTRCPLFSCQVTIMTRRRRDRRRSQSSLRTWENCYRSALVLKILSYLDDHRKGLYVGDHHRVHSSVKFINRHKGPTVLDYTQHPSRLMTPRSHPYLQSKRIALFWGYTSQEIYETRKMSIYIKITPLQLSSKEDDALKRPPI